MKLYTQNGRWVGTQAEAKREFGEVTLVDVPTDKQALLDWLNEHQVGGSGVTTHTTATAAPVHQSNLTKPHAWQTIRECAEKASIADLTVALAVLMNRVSDLADQVGE